MLIAGAGGHALELLGVLLQEPVREHIGPPDPRRVGRDLYPGRNHTDDQGDLQKQERKKKGKSFREASEQFLTEFEQLTAGQRSLVYVDGIRRRLEVNLRPFFGDLGVAEITAGKIQEYRVHRMQQSMEESQRDLERDD